MMRGSTSGVKSRMSSAIFNSRAHSVHRGQSGCCLAVKGERKTTRMTKTDARRTSREERLGDGGHVRCGREAGGNAEEERASEASFPLAACIIQKLAGLYTGRCCTSKQIEMQTAE